MKVANTWLILNVGGGPTDDKPTVTLITPPDPNRTSAFLNIRVADIDKTYKEWSSKGAEFLTEPKDHGREIRAYVRDPDGHLIAPGIHMRFSRGGRESDWPIRMSGFSSDCRIPSARRRTIISQPLNSEQGAPACPVFIASSAAGPQFSSDPPAETACANLR